MMIKKIAAAVTRRRQAAALAEASRAPASFTLDSAFGSVKPAASPADFDALIRAAKDDKALRATNA